MEGFVRGNGDRTAKETDGFGPNDFKPSHAMALKVSLRLRHGVFRFRFRFLQIWYGTFISNGGNELRLILE